ncbi:NDR1/HIN1-like protein 1 [Silene latifolia]|uniref:NDR1/HIN1-like protein 1 n=1 Tax=Silene latifolia TaxID=37657 RepID=UPI003D7728B8
MGVKDCGHHEDKRKKLLKRIAFGILTFIVLVLLIILIIWAVLRPTKPKFVLQDATLYSFNLTSPTQLNSVFQVTVQTRNPNDKIGIYYDRLITYAFYQNQQITLPTSIPPTYQDANGMNVWSPYLQGPSVPIAPYLGAEINQDISMGSVQLVIKMDGRVRFKVGTYVSGSYRIHVNCHAYIPIGNTDNGIYVSRNVIKYTLSKSCDVSV